MVKLQRPEKRGDRSRKREPAYGEAPVKQYIDGMVQVEVSRPATVSRLVGLGWALIPSDTIVTAAKPDAPDARTETPAKKRRKKKSTA